MPAAMPDPRVLWVFVPVLGAYLAHAPVLRFDLLPGLKRPLDGGATLRGRRVLGDNKTWRGALTMFAGVLAATLLLSRMPAYWQRLPDEIREAGPIAFGILLALGVVLGELPNSFLKRQLDIAPGRRRASPAGVALAVFDQGDFVLGVWLLLAPIWTMTVPQALLAFAVVVLVHLVVNLVGYAIGARREWL
jgi:CDP-2,3-bis-(O-geranylgeranyl)-sn-glycerol synthase